MALVHHDFAAALEEERRRDERALRRLTAFAEAVFEFVPVPLFLVTPDLRLVHVNRASRRRHCACIPKQGFPPGTHLRELCFGPALEPHARRVLETGKPVADLVILGRPHEGSAPRRHLVSITTYADEEGPAGLLIHVEPDPADPP